MKHLVWSTYATNAAQVVNMTFFALVLPLAIGFDQYGIYVSLYALPGLLQGMIETMYTIHLSREQLTRADLRTWVALTVGGALSVGVAHQLLFGTNAVYAGIVLVALSTRGLVTGLVYGCKSVSIVRVNVISEALTTLTYLATLALASLVGLEGFRIPLVMMVASQAAAVVYLIGVLRKHGLVVADSPPGFSPRVFRFALIRMYEDIMFTLQPLTLALFAGNVAAGQYRYLVSVTKAASKAFPLRYEILSRHHGAIDRTSVIRLAALSAIAGLAMFFGFRLAETVYPQLQNPATIMLLASGLAVFVTAFLPVLARETPILMAQLLPLALIILVSPAIGGLRAAAVAFLVCNLIAFARVLTQMLSATTPALAQR